MSFVSNVCVIGYVPHGVELDTIPSNHNGSTMGLCNIAQHAGGGKCFEASLYAAGVNHLAGDWLADLCARLGRGADVVIVQETEGIAMFVWRLVGGELSELALESQRPGT